MARVARRSGVELMVQAAHATWAHPWTARARGAAVAGLGLALVAAFATYHPTDPSLDAASTEAARNIMGGAGAVAADLGLQSLGLGAWLIAAMMVASGLIRLAQRDPAAARWRTRWRVTLGLAGVLCLVGLLAAPAPPANWPLAQGLGGVWGSILLALAGHALAAIHLPAASLIAAVLLGAVGLTALALASGARAMAAEASAWLAARQAQARAAFVRPPRAPATSAAKP
ncbi:MAG: DNA translocase FtsK 4TM domain-containing protein, partial [Caulobacteraceae bacterium]|nr:DNA translocase FtsK 4TM domain-containing protein [Caulobacteraceae bacterium]